MSISKKILGLTVILFFTYIPAKASAFQSLKGASLATIGKSFCESDARPKKHKSGLGFNLIKKEKEIIVISEDAPDAINVKSVVCSAMVASDAWKSCLRIQTKKHQLEVVYCQSGETKKSLNYFKESENEGASGKELHKARSVLRFMAEACKRLYQIRATGACYLLDKGILVGSYYSAYEAAMIFRKMLELSGLKCERAIDILMKKNTRDLDCFVHTQ